MISIQTLVETTKRVKARSDASLGWPLAATRAVESLGIREPGDVRRLVRKVMAELGSHPGPKRRRDPACR